MLGATTTGAVGDKVSIPPRYEELTTQGRRDWKTGVDLTHTCVETHNTATYVNFLTGKFDGADVDN